MAAGKLVFGLPPASSGRLVFGITQFVDSAVDATLPELTLAVAAGRASNVTFDATLPELTLAASLMRGFSGTVDATFPGLTLNVAGVALTGYVYNVAIAVELPPLSVAAEMVVAAYADVAVTLPGLSLACTLSVDLNVSRPVVGQVTPYHQIAAPLAVGVEVQIDAALSMIGGLVAKHSNPERAHSGVADVLNKMLGGKVDASSHHAAAVDVAVPVATSSQDMTRDRRAGVSARNQNAAALRTQVATSSQDRYRDRRPGVGTSHQTGVPLRSAYRFNHSVAVHLRKAWGVRHQEAMRPPAGVATVTPPVDQPCYTPDPKLVFSQPATSIGRLIFRCDAHDSPPGPDTVIVPVRRIYMVTNTVTLRRVGSGIDIPSYSFSLSLDVDSWTWGFNAALPGRALADIAPEVDGSPAVLEATINGTAYRVMVEGRGRARKFASDAISVTGRGLGALLGDDYDPIANYGSDELRTAQQLMGDILSDNGVPLDWTVDFGLDDWLVPAGAWALRGSRMSALQAIAAAAGGYIQPHATAKALRVLHRYPAAPWDWGSMTPDFVLPSSVVIDEGTDWARKPAYNRVFVSGQKFGPLAEVTRGGTPGDLAAPSIVDPLITATAAARQRGRAVLSDTGHQARVRLRLPVLNDTGIILPGKTVRYNDDEGASRFGIVRSTAVDVSFPDVWQSIGVETHV